MRERGTDANINYNEFLITWTLVPQIFGNSLSSGPFEADLHAALDIDNVPILTAKKVTVTSLCVNALLQL
jgi:hypothetical protein